MNHTAPCDDPIQNILYCMDAIQFARSHQDQEPWLAMIGECDHMAEIHRELEELGLMTSAARHLCAGASV